MTDLSDTARSLFAPGKGILAADESAHTADARLTLYGIPASEEMRREMRELFLGTPGIEEFLSGVILFTETLSQKADSGETFPELLQTHGVLPGIKVDEGTEPFPESPEEVITKGLLTLPARLVGYRDTYGAKFTKWRSVVRIEGDRLPTAQALVENAKRLALYARAVQEAGLVPIVEPEVLLAGTHSRVRSRQVLEATLTTVMEALADQSVDLSGVVLKTAMALSGSDSGRTDTPDEVAEDTVETLLAVVPNTLAGIVFLSGGQTPDQATANLAAITKYARAKRAPWPITYSYARAIQEEALQLWKGEKDNLAKARAAYLLRLVKVTKALSL